MRKSFKTTIIGLLFLLVPVFAMAAGVTGSIQGFMCVTQGKVCPIGKEDAVAAVENVFVLLVDAAKDEYYFIPNVDRSVLVRHLNTQVTVEGTVDAKKKTIKAMDITSAGKKVWSQNMEDEIYKDLWGSGPGGSKK
ncbi:MAG: hypothetical protein EHM30_07395 [Desulfobacteraceae bacterium]|nr:MAG: hypothetical protein EHM30_07395 [Desulfobacteraceae bacterium]